MGERADRKALWAALAAVIAAVVANAGKAAAQPASDDTLRLETARLGETLAVTVFLDSPSPAVQGLSFALCHDASDLLLESKVEGPALTDPADGGDPADFIVLRSGIDRGRGFVILAAVLDFREPRIFPDGSELVTATFSLQPGGAGGVSLEVCEDAGDPPVETIVSRGGASFTPEVELPENTVRATRDAPARFGTAVTAISVTTGEAGITAGTLLLAAGAGLDFGRVRVAPDLEPLLLGSPVVSEAGGVLSLGFTLSRSSGRVLDMPLFLVALEVSLDEPGATAAVSFAPGSTVRLGGGADILPGTADGSVRVAAAGEEVGAYVLPRRGVTGAVNPVNVPLLGVLPIPEEGGVTRIVAGVTYDANPVTVAELPASAFRGAGLAAFLAANPPAPGAETSVRGRGFILYDIDLPRPLERGDLPAYPFLDLLSVPLTRLSAQGIGLIDNIAVPVRHLPGASEYALDGAGGGETIRPRTDDGVIVIGDPASVAPPATRFHATRAFGPPGGEATARVLIDTNAEVQAYSGSLCHDPDRATVRSVSFRGDLVSVAQARGAFCYIDRARFPDDPTERATGIVYAMAFGFPAVIPPSVDFELYDVTYEIAPEAAYGDAMPLDLDCILRGKGMGGVENDSPFNCLSGAGQPVARVTTVNGQTVVPNSTPGELVFSDPPAAFRPESLPQGSPILATTESGAVFTFSPPYRRAVSAGLGRAWASRGSELRLFRLRSGGPPVEVGGPVPLGGEVHGVAADREGDAWAAVAGELARLVRVAPEGAVLRDVFLAPGAREPRDVTIDEEGGLWVSYEDQPFLSRASPDGTLVRPLAARLRVGPPAGMTTDGRGTIWASDAGDSSLLAFDLDGREIRRLPLSAVPTDVSVGGEGHLWTTLGGSLVRVDPESGAETAVIPSAVLHGDRTGLTSLRLAAPTVDNDGDGIPNLIEIEKGTNPLDGSSPLGAAPPVADLLVKVLSVGSGGGSGAGSGAGAAAVTAGDGSGSGAPLGSTNEAGLAWTNPTEFDVHIVQFNDREPTAVPGDATAAVIEGVPPGFSVLSVTSLRGAGESPAVETLFQFGPGMTASKARLRDVQPAGIAVAEGGLLLVIDRPSGNVLVLDSELHEVPSLGIRGKVELGPFTGVAYRPDEGGGAGTIGVISGFGIYQEFPLAGGEPVFEPAVVPGPAGPVSFTSLASGSYGGGPALFTIARSPHNDCIIAFRIDDGASDATLLAEIAHPFHGFQGLALGGVAYDSGGALGRERLWLATGLPGEVAPRFLVDVPLDGSVSTGRMVMQIFQSSAGAVELRGFDLSPERGSIVAATSDQTVHILSDFGVPEGPEDIPRITSVYLDSGEGGAGIGKGGDAGTFGSTAGGDVVILEGENFGADCDDLAVFFGETLAVPVPGGCESEGGSVVRIAVSAPPHSGEEPVPILLFRSRGLDVRPSAFHYCDRDPASEPDCDGDLVPDGCQLAENDCNDDGILDRCQLAENDCNCDGVPDDCQLATGDVDRDGVLDACERDCNQDGIPDPCQLAAEDCDRNGLIDSCQPEPPEGPACADGPPFIRGDADASGLVTINDPIRVFNFLFLGADDPVCRDTADADDNGETTLNDGIRILNVLFLGLGEIPAPGHLECGHDPSADKLPACDYPQAFCAP